MLSEQDNVNRKLNIAVSVTLLVACLGVISQSIMFFANYAKRPQHATAIGHTISLEEGSWANQEQTVVLALSTTCHYCNDSYPFYKRLLAAASAKHTRVVATFPQTDAEVRSHLADKQVSGLVLLHGGLKGVEIDGTPTLLLVDSKGKVRRQWVGLLSPTQELEVLSQL